jgi:hypothetical protein
VYVIFNILKRQRHAAKSGIIAEWLLGETSWNAFAIGDANITQLAGVYSLTRAVFHTELFGGFPLEKKKIPSEIC